MAPPPSLDLRRCAVDAYLTGDDSVDRTAARFAIGRASLVRWLQRRRRSSSLAPYDAKPGPAPKARLREELALRQAVNEQPDVTLRELSARLEDRTGVLVGTSAVDNITLAAVLGRRGILATLMLHGGIYGEHFIAYILQFVVPDCARAKCCYSTT